MNDRPIVLRYNYVSAGEILDSNNDGIVTYKPGKTIKEIIDEIVKQVKRSTIKNNACLAVEESHNRTSIAPMGDMKLGHLPGGTKIKLYDSIDELHESQRTPELMYQSNMQHEKVTDKMPFFQGPQTAQTAPLPQPFSDTEFQILNLLLSKVNANNASQALTGLSQESKNGLKILSAASKKEQKNVITPTG